MRSNRIPSTSKQTNAKSPIREQTCQCLTVRIRPKHSSIKINQSTLLATKNYVALSSPSHMEIRRSEIHVSLNTIIIKKSSFVLPRTTSPSIPYCIWGYVWVRLAILSSTLIKTFLRPLYFLLLLSFEEKKWHRLTFKSQV